MTQVPEAKIQLTTSSLQWQGGQGWGMISLLGAFGQVLTICDAVCGCLYHCKSILPVESKFPAVLTCRWEYAMSQAQTGVSP